MKYRKSIIFYHDDIDWEALFCSAEKIWLPVGLNFSSNCFTSKNVEYYYLPSSLNKITKKFIDASIVNKFDIDGGVASVLDVVCCNAGEALGHRGGVIERIFNPIDGFDCIGVPDPVSNIVITEGRQRYLKKLLNSRNRVYGLGSPKEAVYSELFVQWGAEPSEAKERPEVARSFLDRPRLYLEDGFIRSVGLWTDPNEPTISVVMDTLAVYYDSSRASVLENILNSAFALSDEQCARARRMINRIVDRKVSKYNYAPVIDLGLRDINGKRNILLVDQKSGDMSIKYGGASDETFNDMLSDALKLSEDCNIIIKQHPCAITGGEENAHYTAKNIKSPNVHLIGFDINPYSLISQVDEVWVVSSGMGFEALMAGKHVKCYGLPFYSNWGITEDVVVLPRRKIKRSLEDIFFVFYILLTAYVDPDTGDRCELERVIDYFSSASSN